MLSQPFRQRNRTDDSNCRSRRTTLEHHGNSLCAHLNNLSRPKRSFDQHFPDRIAKILHKENFDLHPGRALPTCHACGHDLCIVDHKEIAGPKKIRQLIDTTMSEPMVGTLQHKQPGVITREPWANGDQRGIKRKVEF
jgi:hypothetical protein